MRRRGRNDSFAVRTTGADAWFPPRSAPAEPWRTRRHDSDQGEACGQARRAHADLVVPAGERPRLAAQRVLTELLRVDEVAWIPRSEQPGIGVLAPTIGFTDRVDMRPIEVVVVDVSSSSAFVIAVRPPNRGTCRAASMLATAVTAEALRARSMSVRARPVSTSPSRSTMSAASNSAA